MKLKFNFTFVFSALLLALSANSAMANEAPIEKVSQSGAVAGDKVADLLCWHLDDPDHPWAPGTWNTGALNATCEYFG
jgi:hypothetical protein